MFRLIPNMPFFNVPDGNDGGKPGSGTEPLTANSLERMLEEDDDNPDAEDLDIDDKPEKPTKKDSSEEDSSEDDEDSGEEAGETGEDEDLDDLEEDLDEPSEDKLQLMTPSKRKDILKDYPDLFKKHPYLETAYFREQKFTEIFPAIKDAEAAAKDVKILSDLENDLQEGNLERLLSGLHKGNKQSYHQAIDNLLPTLAKVDRESYDHLLSNITKHTIHNLYEAGQEEGQEVLKNVALLLNQWAFGSSKFEAPARLTKAAEKNPEAERLAQERQDFERQRFTTARDGLITRVDNTLKNTIQNNIDPKESMSDYVREKAVEDAQRELEKQLTSDTRFQKILLQYWNRAKASNYSDTAMKEVRKAYLSRAKTLLPGVIQAARNKALKGLAKSSSNESRNSERPVRKGPIAPGKSAASNNRGNNGNGSGGNSRGDKLPPGTNLRNFLEND